jgi:hypothetical protein
MSSTTKTTQYKEQLVTDLSAAIAGQDDAALQPLCSAVSTGLGLVSDRAKESDFHWFASPIYLTGVEAFQDTCRVLAQKPLDWGRSADSEDRFIALQSILRDNTVASCLCGRATPPVTRDNLVPALVALAGMVKQVPALKAPLDMTKEALGVDLSLWSKLSVRAPQVVPFFPDRTSQAGRFSSAANYG